MGWPQLKEFIEEYFGPVDRTPIGFGSLLRNEAQCRCPVCEVLASLSKAECVFLISTFREEHVEDFETAVRAIREVRSQLDA